MNRYKLITTNLNLKITQYLLITKPIIETAFSSNQETFSLVKPKY